MKCKQLPAMVIIIKKKKKKIKFQGTVGESNPWCSDAGNVNAYRLYEKPFVWFLNH